MSDWGAQSFQAVWFTAPAAMNVTAIFTGLVGANPDNVHQQSVGVAIALGSDGVTQFRVQSQPGRIDYFETAVANQAIGFPLIYNLVESFAAFTRRITSGVESVGKANRLAVVVTLAKEIDNAGEGSLILGQLLSSEMPFSDVENIHFQINRRRNIPNRSDIEMNRLLTMQLQTVQQFDMIDPTSPVLKAVEIAVISADCNTHSRELLTLPPAEQVPIWKELTLEAERLCDAKSIKSLS
jgi:hypothetical protein